MYSVSDELSGMVLSKRGISKFLSQGIKIGIVEELKPDKQKRLSCDNLLVKMYNAVIAQLHFALPVGWLSLHV